DIFSDFNESAKIGQTGYSSFDNSTNGEASFHASPWIGSHFFERQADFLAFSIQADDFHFQVLANFNHLFRVSDFVGPGQIGNVNQALNSTLDFHEYTKVGDVADFTFDRLTNVMTFEDFFPWIIFALLDAQSDFAAVFFEAEDFTFHFVADFQNFFRMLDALCPGNVRNMNQTFDTFNQL